MGFQISRNTSEASNVSKDYSVFPLLDIDGSIGRFMKEYTNSLADAITPRPTWANDEDDNQQAPGNPSIAIPCPNYDQLPDLEPNQFIHPTGATRFSYGFFIVHDDDIVKIAQWQESSNYNNVNTLYRGLVLDINDLWGNTKVRLKNMSALTPIPISKTEVDLYTKYKTSDTRDIYLLPIVDERFWWQSICADISLSGGESWADLVADVAGTEGVLSPVSFEDTVDAKYLQPDPLEFSRKTMSVGQMLEAIAWSVGQRLVPDGDHQNTISPGSVNIYEKYYITTPEKADSSGTIVRDSGGPESDNANTIAGGWQESEWGVPASIDVVFRKWVDSRPKEDSSDLYIKNYSERELVEDSSHRSGYVYGKKRILCSYPALYTEAEFDSDPDAPSNQSQLDDLAEQIVKDFYAWKNRVFSFTRRLVQNRNVIYSGSIYFDLGGQEDYVLWTVDGKNRTSKIKDLSPYVGASTRWIGSTTQADYNQLTSATTWAQFVEFTLGDTLTRADKTITGNVVSYNFGDDPGDTVTLLNPESSGTGDEDRMWSGNSGDYGYAVYDPGSDEGGGGLGEYRILSLQSSDSETPAQPGEDCAYCVTNTTPQQLKVDIVGFANNSCSTCDVYNGSFTVTQNGIYDPCGFQSLENTTNCSGAYFTIFVRIVEYGIIEEWPATRLKIIVDLIGATGVSMFHFETAYGTETSFVTANCQGIDEIVPYTFTGTSAGGYCLGADDVQVRVRSVT